MSGAANQQESEKESESESETESENQSESEIFQPETEPASGEIDDSRPDNGEAEDSEKTTEELCRELTMKMAEAEKQAQSLTEELKNLLEKTDTEEPDDTSYSVYTEQLKDKKYNNEDSIITLEQQDDGKWFVTDIKDAKQGK